MNFFLMEAGEFSIYNENQKSIKASVEEAEAAEAYGQWDLKWQVKCTIYVVLYV